MVWLLFAPSHHLHQWWPCSQLISPWTKWPPLRQMTISNAFSWMKMIEFWLDFHLILFPGVQFTISQHWFRYWLSAGQVTSHYLNKYWPSSLMHICSTRGDELNVNDESIPNWNISFAPNWKLEHFLPPEMEHFSRKGTFPLLTQHGPVTSFEIYWLINGLGNGLEPDQHQAITWTKAVMCLVFNKNIQP